MADPTSELSVVVPDLFDRSGGIARISRALVLACHRFCAARGLTLKAYVLNDSGMRRDFAYLPAGAKLAGFDGRRPAMARAVLEAARKPTHAGTVFAHVNQATLGLGFPLHRGEDTRRYVVLTHGIEVWERLPLHRRLALECARKIWTVSAFTARRIEDLHDVHDGRLRVVHNCLDPFWNTSSPAAEPSGRRFALAVARLSKGDAYKGLDFALQAFAAMAPQAPDLDFVIAGDGDDRPRLERIARETGLGSRIRFVGAVSDEALRELYAGCAFFVLPSKKEGFGLVFLEAMANGKAVLAADEGGSPEVVVPNATGLLVPYGDIPALASGFTRLADPVLAQRKGHEGLRRLNERFRFEHYQRRMDAALSELIGAKTDADSDVPRAPITSREEVAA